MTEQYDPADHTVQEVQAYLAKADPAEVKRVQDAEAAGTARKGIVEYQPSPSDVKASGDGYTRVLVKDAYQPAPVLEREDEPAEV